MESVPTKNTDNQEVSDFSIKDFLKICYQKWYWFLIFLVCSVGIALFYIYRTQPVYERYEQILVSDQDTGGAMDVSNAFSSMGLFSKNTNVYNELISIKSPAVMYEVVDTLQLDYNYLTPDGLRAKTLYGKNLPVRVDMLDIDRQGSAGFRFILNPDMTVSRMWKFAEYTLDGQIKHKGEVEMPAGSNVANTPIGRVMITPNPTYNGMPLEKPLEIRVNKTSMQSAVELYGQKMNGDLADLDADVIELSIRDVSVQRAVDILTQVLNVYNQNWIDDKNRMAIATSRFIDERLRVIQQELGDVDLNVADLMKETATPNLEVATKAAVEKSSKIEQEMIMQSNQLAIAQYMKDFINNDKNENVLLPVNLGIDNEEFGMQVLNYNELLLNRNSVAANSSETNPLVMNYDQQLRELRKAILQSVNNQIAALKKSVGYLKDEISKIDTKMAGSPKQVLPLLQEQRQQEVKEELYLFLLQKREENELTQKFSADNTRVITPPTGSLKPVAPRKALIIIVSIILGLGIPLLILYILETADTTVRGKKDLDNVVMPFAGEIPQVGKKKKLKPDTGKLLGKNKKDETAPMAVVEEGKRDVVNEAFRVIRSNIDFMSGKDAGTQVIMLTSFNPGSGKSFITYNLALSFAIKNKKVLIIDCDLRHGSSSMYVGMPHKGLANYLTGNTDDWRSLVVKTTANPNLSILPIGKMPPNPAELLENGRLEEIVKEARKDYDIIFLDCPPVNIVVDTQLVGPLADRTLFVVRAGLLERSALKDLNEFYAEKKFKNMSLILNGTEAIHSRYYTYGNYQNLN